MFKKIASIAIAAMMLCSTAAIAASAAESDEAVAAADDSSAVAAADDSAVGAENGSEATGAGSEVSFQVPSDWKNFKKIYLYLYDHANGEKITWGSKKGMMTDKGNGIWSFDLGAKGFDLGDGNAYGCIFTADWGMQTCDIIIGTACYGDTAVCTGNMVENNVDSNKKSYEVKWTNADSSTYGVPKCITSIGNVIGSAYWPGENGYSMFVKFLKSTGTDGIDNALKFNGKTAQQTIDDTAKALGLGTADIEKAIKESGRTFDWKAASSDAGEGSGDSGAPSSDSSGSDSSSSSSSSGSSSSGSSSSSSGSSSSSSGSSSVTSGEDSTIYFILGGVMLAAIGVLFLARKRRQY